MSAIHTVFEKQHDRVDHLVQYGFDSVAIQLCNDVIAEHDRNHADDVDLARHRRGDGAVGCYYAPMC